MAQTRNLRATVQAALDSFNASLGNQLHEEERVEELRRLYGDSGGVLPQVISGRGRYICTYV